MPQTVPEDLIQDANAADRASSTPSPSSPARRSPPRSCSGVGAGWAFALDAATFLVSAAFLHRACARASAASARSAGAVLAELREGWTEVRAARVGVGDGRALLRRVLLVASAPCFVLGPTVAEERLRLTGVFGLLAGGDGRGHDRRRADRLPLAAGSARCAPAFM